MSAGKDKAAPARRPFGIREVVSYGLIVGSVALAWQIVLQPLAQRAPAAVAIRVAPGSPLVLRRAAEAEFEAGRIENAAALSRDSLARAPFDVRALRVVGLTEAKAGREDRADEILTLAGNWSLRDDPAHAWLVDRRLRRGDYASAFAHADTLVRRRDEMQASVFKLFTAAGTVDALRAQPLLADLLATRPPWRTAYLYTLNQTPQDLQLAANLALMVEARGAPLTNNELQALYLGLLDKAQVEAISVIRRELKRPPFEIAVTNGGFSDKDAAAPFQWNLIQKAGIASEIVEDDLRPSNPALRVEYDGYASGVVAEQLTSLPPGAYRFSTEIRNEAGEPASRLAWTLTCAIGGHRYLSTSTGIESGPENWTTLSDRFEVPAGCPIQWLRLDTRAGDSRAHTVVWFDRIAITPGR